MENKRIKFTDLHEVLEELSILYNLIDFDTGSILSCLYPHIYMREFAELGFYQQRLIVFDENEILVDLFAEEHYEDGQYFKYYELEGFILNKEVNEFVEEEEGLKKVDTLLREIYNDLKKINFKSIETKLVGVPI